MKILSNFLENNSWIWIIIILIVFALIGLIAFIIHKILTKNSKDEKPTEEQIAEENLNSILESVDDEDIKKQFDNFNEEEKNK